jgi:mono/diheme cytochrome c family protein
MAAGGRESFMRQSWVKRSLLLAAAVIIVAGCAFFALSWRPAITPLASAPDVSDRTQVSRGAELAAIGNCITCHTKAGGRPFAGGRPIATPFGTVYATNITPDAETGIGAWNEAAFTRAMRDGVRRDGRHLYPAFPYDHMTKMRDADIQAVYAFMMTRRPVNATAPANDLPFPLNIRALVAGWKLLFLDKGVMQPDPAKSEDWNRGAYLVEGLGHCGACHTPRNVLGAEKRDQAYAGGESEGWIAPALNESSPAAVPWDADRLYRYLRHGFDELHGTAAGPMAPVVDNLKDVAEKDVRAMATYVADIAGAPSPERQARASKALERSKSKGENLAKWEAKAPGAMIYAGACAQCHGEAGRAPTVPALNLALSSSLRNARPDNAIRIVRDGIHPFEGGGGAIMPGFAGALTDAQVVSLMGYLRSAFTDLPAWRDVDKALNRIKQGNTGRRSAQGALIER